MKVHVSSALGALCICMFCAVPTARATKAYLVFTNGTNSSVSVAPGGSFSFTVDVVSPDSSQTDGVTGLDYFLEATSSFNQSAANGAFTIQSRNTVSDGSEFGGSGVTYVSDSSVTSAGNVPNISSTGANNLGSPPPAGTYINGVNLGGQENSMYSPVQNATAIVADYSISVAANALPGVYTLTTYSQPGTGYSDATINGSDQTFSQPASYTITVTPEPASAGFGLILGLGALMHRSRRSRLLA